MTIEEVAGHFEATTIEPVPIAHDWRDGFLFAFWRRPEAYLDPVVRANISVFARLGAGRGGRVRGAAARRPRRAAPGRSATATCWSSTSSTAAIA